MSTERVPVIQEISLEPGAISALLGRQAIWNQDNPDLYVIDVSDGNEERKLRIDAAARRVTLIRGIFVHENFNDVADVTVEEEAAGYVKIVFLSEARGRVDRLEITRRAEKISCTSEIGVVFQATLFLVQFDRQNFV